MVDGKTIRMDIYASEEKGTVYDAEMQNLYSKTTVDALHLPLRTRAYQAMIDSDILDKGTQFKDLPDVNIIFICMFDPFKKGKYLYLFENTCTGDTELKLEDKARRFFFNVTSRDPEMPKEIRALFDYILNRSKQSDLAKRIDYAVERVKRNNEERSQYMHIFLPDDLIEEAKAIARAEAMEEGRAEGLEAGRAEGLEAGRAEGLEAGRKEARTELVKEALARGKTCEEIVEFCGLLPEEVKRIKSEM